MPNVKTQNKSYFRRKYHNKVGVAKLLKYRMNKYMPRFWGLRDAFDIEPCCPENHNQDDVLIM